MVHKEIIVRENSGQMRVCKYDYLIVFGLFFYGDGGSNIRKRVEYTK